VARGTAFPLDTSVTSSGGSGLEGKGATVEGVALAVVAVVASTETAVAVEAAGTEEDPVAPDPAGSVGKPSELLGAVGGTVTDEADRLDARGTAGLALVVLLLQPTPARRPVANKP
jgi:hypothetical protein